MTFQAFKEAVIALCKEKGITEYELYYQTGSSTEVAVYLHELSQFSSNVEGGVCFRCLVNGKMAYASSDELSEAQAALLVDKALDNATVLESEEPEFFGEGGQEYAPLELTKRPEPSTEELIAKALDTQEQLYGANPAVVDGCSSESIAESSEIAIYNSKGLDLHYANNISGLMVAAVVSDGQDMANDWQFKFGTLSEIDTAALTKKAADTAVSKLGGDVAPTGNYPVVFDPDAMSSLLSAFSGIFSSEVAQKGLSRLADKEGNVIAAPCVTLVDDPFHKDNPFPINFDSEGSPTYCKKVIENGKLNTLLYNLKTAAVAGKKTTGNGSKAGYASKVGVSPFTMYLAGGEISEEELLEKAGNGVYINDLGGLHAGANAVSGDFSLQSAGYMIENGKKTTAVKSFTVAGNFYDLLNQITAVANNCKLPNAMGTTAFGAPSVLVEGLSVAGK